jgi:hypothetical protein
MIPATKGMFLLGKRRRLDAAVVVVEPTRLGAVVG